MLGPHIKSRGTGDTKMSENADLITVGTYAQQEKITSFSDMGQNVNLFLHIWLSMSRLGISCFPAILSPISTYMSNKEAI